MTGTDIAAVVEHVVIGGVDSHADTVHVAVVTDRGGQIADAEFPTTTAGYTAALAFLAAHGTVAAVGVEGTSSYGSGFTHAAREAGLTVVEVNRPDKAEHRRIGKSDPIDAYAAARAVVSGRATSAPKGDAVAGIRALHNAARSAVKARTAALNLIGHILITAPDSIRTKYEVLRGDKRIDALVRLRVGNDPVHIPILTALRTLARRVQNLTAEHAALTAELDVLVTQLNPGLRAAYGVGPDTATQLLITAGDNPARLRTEASFAALCGVAPVPASSGKTNRHRLSRGGDRAANGALYRIALVRMRRDQRTRDYVERQTKAAGRRRRSSGCSNAPSPGSFPSPDHRSRGSRDRGSQAYSPGQEHHAHRRSEPLRSLARRHLQHRTGTPPRRHLRRRLSQMAHCRLTNDRSIKVMDGMSEWQNRPLDPVYPVSFIDCVHVKVRDGQVANRPIYVALAVTVDGTRDILGLWAGDGGEGAVSEQRNCGTGVNDQAS